MGIALAEDGVLAVELGDGVFGDEELRAVGAAARWAGTGIRHGEAAGDVEGEGGIDLVFEEVTWVAHACSGGVAALDHEAGDDSVEGGAVVEGLVVHLLQGLRVGPVFGAFGEADEVGYGEGGLLVVEFAGEAAHGGVDDGGGAGGDYWWQRLRGGGGSVGEVLCGGFRGLGGLREGCSAEGQCECEITQGHAVYSSMKQAIVDAELGQFARGLVAV